MRPAHRALLTVAVSVVGYNVAASEGETISEGIDALLVEHPLLTRMAILGVAAHVANQLPGRADPLGIAFWAMRRLRPVRRLVVVVESEPIDR